MEKNNQKVLHKTLKERQKNAHTIFAKEFGYKNAMQAPRILKVVVAAGVGSFKDKKKIELAADRLAKITGQKPVLRGAKKSIASYKTRTGDPVGYQVTLRGDKMWNFLEKLVHVALPRTKDFRGLSRRAADGIGGYTIGIKENTIFPETSDEDLKDVFGLAVSIVTNVKKSRRPKGVGIPTELSGKNETLRFFEILGFPIQK